MSDKDDRIESAPEGSECAQHPDTPALVTCPRCRSHCCIVCWQGALHLCHECLLRDPMPGVPWADADKSLGSRLFGTLGGAFAPSRSAPSFMSGDWKRGLSFFAVVALPIAALSGIIPFTHRLGFGAWSVRTLNDPSGGEIALDIAQAVGLGLLLGAVKLALIALPYLSLTRAYGVKLESSPERQVMVYRAWLLFLSGPTGLLLGIVAWGMPAATSDTLLLLAQVISLTPLMILLPSMTSTARMMRVGPVASMVVVIVPFVLLVLVEPLVLQMLAPWLPDSGVMQQASGAAQ